MKLKDAIVDEIKRGNFKATEITCNGLQTKNIKRIVRSDGSQAELHILKRSSEGYTIGFDPERQEWYKVPPRETLLPRLQTSMEAVDFVLATHKKWLYLWESQFQKIFLDGEERTAHKSPHFGITLEAILIKAENELKEKIIDKTQLQEVYNGVREVYEAAYMEALFLLKDYGIFMGDPNPGNIVLANEEGVATDNMDILLIDFPHKGAKPSKMNDAACSRAKETLRKSFERHIKRCCGDHNYILTDRS